MRQLVLSILLGLLALPLSGQILNIEDQETGDRVPFVSISTLDSDLFTMTNEDGQADIAVFLGTDTIVIRCIGYELFYTSYAQLKDLNFVLSIQPTTFSLDQVVISANRWNQRRQDVPARIQSINRTSIARQDPQTAADLLNLSGEVMVQKSQLGGGSPMIRGFSANRLLYSVDGVRMNTAIFRSGNLHNVISLDPMAVENTEVLFGPGSIMYGSDAIGAVMSFTTLKPEFAGREKKRIKGNTKLRFSGANEEFTGHIDVNIGRRKVAFLTSFTGSNFKDLRMGSNGPEEYLRPFHVIPGGSNDITFPIGDPRLQVPTGYDQINFMQKVRYQLHPDWELNYGFHFSKTSNIPRYDRLIRLGRDSLPISGEWYYGPQRWQMHNLQVLHKQQSTWYDQMSIRIAQQLFQESRNDRNFGEEELFIQEEQVQAYSANIDFHKKLNPKSKLFYGLETVYNRVTSNGYSRSIETDIIGSGPARYPIADWTSLAAYANYQYRPSEKWLWQAGLRYSQFLLSADFSNNADFFPLPQNKTELNTGALNGSLGAVFRPGNDWSFHLNLGTGFRAPNIDDIGKVFDSEPGAVVIPNMQLAPEYAYNAEIGFTKKFGNRLMLDLAAYYTLLDDALLRRNFSLNGQDSILYKGEMSQVQAIQNLAQVNIYGVQAGAELLFSSYFRLVGHFNWQAGEENTNDGVRTPSQHVAPWFGDLRLQYKRNRIFLELFSQFSGSLNYESLSIGERNKAHLYSQDEFGRPYSPAWYTLNFRASFSIRKQMKLNLGLENITDQRYRTYSSGIAAPGRNFIMSLNVAF